MKGRKFRFSKGTSCSAHLMKFAIDEIFRQFSPLSTIEEESRFSFSSPKVNLLQIEYKTSLLLLSPDLLEEIRLKSHKSWFFRFFSYRRQTLFDQIATCWKVVLGVLFLWSQRGNSLEPQELDYNCKSRSKFALMLIHMTGYITIFCLAQHSNLEKTQFIFKLLRIGVCEYE